MKISPSELSTLAQCEWKWHFKYEQEEEDPPGPALQLGTLVHKWGEAWHSGEGAVLPSYWVDDYLVYVKGVAPKDAIVHLSDFPEETIVTAEWLAGRYEEHYGPRPPENWEIIATEPFIPFDFGDGVQVICRADHLIRIHDDEEYEGLWLREMKSYGRNSRLELTTISPQETTYLIGAEEAYGERPRGILFDGVYTYQWVKPRPAVDSFQRIWTNRNEEQVQLALRQLGAAVDRKYELIGQPITSALANVGPLCTSCNFKHQCFQRMLGDDYSEIAVEDDE